MSLTKVTYSMINGAPAANIVDYGGASGSANNTAAMDAAAAALNAVGGGVILIPNVGEWRMNWVCLYNNITVQGVGGKGEFDLYCIRPYSMASAPITFGDGSTVVRYCGLKDVHISGTDATASGVTLAANNAPHTLRLRGGVVNFTADRVVLYNGVKSLSLEPSATQPITNIRINNGTIRNDITDSSSARAIYMIRLADPGYLTDVIFNETKVNGPTLGYAAEINGTATGIQFEVSNSYWDIKPDHGIALTGTSGIVCNNLTLDPGTTSAVIFQTDQTDANPSTYVTGVMLHGGQLFRCSTGTIAIPSYVNTFGRQPSFREVFVQTQLYLAPESDPYNTNISFGVSSTSGPVVFNGGVDLIVTGQFYPSTDNTIALGGSSHRWSVVYAGTGTINTSDEKQKQDVAALTTAEQKVAKSIKSLVKTFRFKDSVVDKGNKARIHVGVLAQDIQAAFEAEGLDAENYGMFCSDTLEDGSTQLGIRYDELICFVIAAM